MREGGQCTVLMACDHMGMYYLLISIRKKRSFMFMPSMHIIVYRLYSILIYF